MVAPIQGLPLPVELDLLLDPQARFVDLGVDFHDRLHP